MVVFAALFSRRRAREAVLAQWVDAHAARLHQAAARMTSPGEAPDLCQEVFLVATRRFADFDGRSAPYTWLYGILRNLVWDRRKKAQRRGLRVIDAAPQGAPDDPEQALSASQDRAQVRAAVARLPEPQRVAVTLFYVEAMPVAEIAARLQVPVGTVKSRLYQARQALQGALREVRDAV